MFDCTATGFPKPHVAWYFNGERMLLNERIILQHNGSILIKNVQNSDAGVYTCQVENIHGKISASVPLEVTGEYFVLENLINLL